MPVDGTSNGAMSSPTRADQGFERYVRECIRSREIAEAHFVAELSNDPDVILKSMKSCDPLLTSVVVPSRMAAGNTLDVDRQDAGSLQLVCCTTLEQQRAFYRTSRAETHMVNLELFTTLGRDWYGFVHGVVTSELRSTKERVTAELIGLLPSTPDEDTIAGEVGLGWPGAPAKLGDPPGHVAQERTATLRVHDAWLEAFRRGDPERIGDLYATEAQCATRHPITGEVTPLTGRDAVVGYYRELFEQVAVTSADIVLRMVDRWYAFCELLVRLEHSDRGELVARLADVCVAGNDDSILVHLATSAGPASPAPASRR